MAGVQGARRFTEADKARALVSLAANDNNIKRTSRECNVPPATLRRWREASNRGNAPSSEMMAEAIDDFVAEVETVRNLALQKLHALVAADEVKPQQLIVIVGVLDDKATRAKGLPTSKVEHTSTLPKPDELKELMSGFVAGAIEAAERRHSEIIDAEVIEVSPLEISR